MNFLHRPTLLILGISVVAMILFSGCNTTRGFGKDVQKAGQSIEQASH